MLMRVRRITGGTLIVLLALQLAACSLNRRVAIAHANKQLSEAGLQMRDFVQGQYDARQMPVAEYEVWKKRLGKAGTIGRLMTDALIAGNDDIAQIQIDAFLELLLELEKENVIKLNPNQQAIAYVIIASIRTTINILVMTVL
jgi:hypothetical protein